MPTKLKYGCCTVRHTDPKSFEYLQSTYFINTMFLHALEAVKCQQIFILLWKEVLHTSVRRGFGVQSKLKTNSVCVVLLLCATLSLLWLQSRLKSQHSPQRWEKLSMGLSLLPPGLQLNIKQECFSVFLWKTVLQTKSYK